MHGWWQKIQTLKDHPAPKIAAFLILLVMAFVAWRFPYSSQHKSFKIGLISNAEPINISGDVKKDKLQITYDGQPVRKLVYLKFRLKNDGTEPILAADFDEPLRLEFPPDATILDSNIERSDIITGSVESGHFFTFSRSLINSSDTVDVELTLDTSGRSISLADIGIHGRIVGIPELQIQDSKDSEILSKSAQKEKAREQLYNWFVGGGSTAVAFLFFGFIASFIDYKGDDLRKKALAKIVLISLITVLCAVLGSGLILILYTAVKTVMAAF